jgi:hypothetical protein
MCQHQILKPADSAKITNREEVSSAILWQRFLLNQDSFLPLRIALYTQRKTKFSSGEGRGLEPAAEVADLRA